ncbi:unnamed protein product, partial [Hymenolepis diminuta]
IKGIGRAIGRLFKSVARIIDDIKLTIRGECKFNSSFFGSFSAEWDINIFPVCEF